jgi:hypothetical protein
MVKARRRKKINFPPLAEETLLNEESFRIRMRAQPSEGVCELVDLTLVFFIVCRKSIIKAKNFCNSP